MRILVLEPYYDGSHKLFLEKLKENVDAEFEFMTLPARKWKMRMQLSAPWFIKCIEELPSKDRYFDTVLFSTFVDVAVFKALSLQVEGWNRDIRYCTYFHENQFVYPNQEDAPENYQFTSINFNSALVSDSIAFNSKFNRDTFLAGCKKYLKSASDTKIDHYLNRIDRKCCVIYPGLDYGEIDVCKKFEKTNSNITIVWNHRWEHDKNPEEFFNALYELKDKGIRFNLIVLGESFRNMPPCFDDAKEKLKEETIHFGYAKDKTEYFQYLKSADIVVSTAIHEFFGIAIIEAVRAGCFPLLPKRLSYPELFSKRFFYKDGKFTKELEHQIRNYKPLQNDEVIEMTEAYSWQRLKEDYQVWLKGSKT